ncbi:MAG: N-acetyl-1-D-myo-inositol-2-amino-2-deoxy-alpha-D-glucopyranoside deacetylase [Dermatophilaceae bacterium]
MARLLFVHAHPDDETLATGVTIAHYVEAGHEVEVLTCTLGDEGEIIPPELAALAASHDDSLASYRAGELAEATARLGARHTVLAGADGQARFRDSGMAGMPSASHPRAFVQADVAQVAALLADHIRAREPDVVVTYDVQGSYGHPDHIQTRRVTQAALAPLGADGRPTAYEIVTPRSWVMQDRAWLGRQVPSDSGLHVPDLGEPYAVSVVDDALVTHVVVDPGALERQARALKAHRTQVRVYDEGYYTLSNHIAARLGGREAFIRFDPATGSRDAPGSAGPKTGLLPQEWAGDDRG